MQVLRDHRVPCVVLKAYRNSVDATPLQKGAVSYCCLFLKQYEQLSYKAWWSQWKSHAFDSPQDSFVDTLVEYLYTQPEAHICGCHTLLSSLFTEPEGFSDARHPHLTQRCAEPICPSWFGCSEMFCCLVFPLKAFELSSELCKRPLVYPASSDLRQGSISTDPSSLGPSCVRKNCKSTWEHWSKSCVLYARYRQAQVLQQGPRLPYVKSYYVTMVQMKRWHRPDIVLRGTGRICCKMLQVLFAFLFVHSKDRNGVSSYCLLQILWYSFNFVLISSLPFCKTYERWVSTV